MHADNEYSAILTHLYEKSLILHDMSQFHKVLAFYFIDSLAHIDYTTSIYTYNYQSPKNIMGAEYLRWRIDEEKKGNRVKFPEFINWLKKEYPEKFAQLPSLWQLIYDDEDPAGYRSFRIVLDPDSRSEIPSNMLYIMIDEFFNPDFLKSLYTDASLATLFDAYISRNSSA
jgi:hypothetical protein